MYLHPTAFYGVMFASNKEAAFSNFRLWQSLGFVIVLAFSSQLCTRSKLDMLMIALISGVIGFLAIEFPMINSIIPTAKPFVE